jgi:hypothetical protein
MTTFDAREKQFEAQFAHDEELRFRVNARRNHMIAEWAIEKMGFSDLNHSFFIDDVVGSFVDGGDEAVIEKIINFLAMDGIEVTPSQVKFELDHFFVEAKKEIMSE